MIRYVSIAQLGKVVTVRVRIAREVVLTDDTIRIRLDGLPRIDADEDAVTISYKRTYLFGLVGNWRRHVF